MLKGSWKLAMVACLIAGLVGTSTAQASDAGLRKVVKRQEKRIAPMAKKFGAADKALAQAPDTSAASAAAAALRKGLRGFKKAVVPIKTQTPTAGLAKKQLLKALREFDLGLVQYQTLLEKVNAGASRVQSACYLSPAMPTTRSWRAAPAVHSRCSSATAWSTSSLLPPSAQSPAQSASASSCRTFLYLWQEI